VVGCCENLCEGLDGAGWVGDAVVEDDYGSGGAIFCYETCRYEPGDVPGGRMDGIVRVGGAEEAGRAGWPTGIFCIMKRRKRTKEGGALRWWLVPSIPVTPRTLPRSLRYVTRRTKTPAQEKAGSLRSG